MTLSHHQNVCFSSSSQDIAGALAAAEEAPIQSSLTPLIMDRVKRQSEGEQVKESKLETLNDQCLILPDDVNPRRTYVKKSYGRTN